MTEQVVQKEQNSIADIRRFFASGQEVQVTMEEFVEFWKSCTEEEKEEFRNADLS